MALFSGCEQHEHSYVPDVTQPTCVDQGFTTYTCECGDSYVADYVEATGQHTYGEWEPTTPASCTQAGENTRYCTGTNCSAFETEPVPMLEHVYLPEVYNPTCTARGYTKYICSCNDSYIEEDYQTPKAMHDFNPSTRVCSSCNKHVDDVDYAKYTSGTSAFYLVQQTTSNYDFYVFGSGSIPYPSNLSNFYNVRKYIERAWMSDNITHLPSNGGLFAYFSSLESVRLSETLTELNTNAFNSCYNLKSVTIPSSVTTMYGSPFYGCSVLEKVIISDVESWCNITFASASSNPLYYASHLYLNDEEITELVIPESVTEIKDYTFINGSFTSLDFSGNVTSIGDSAFKGCSALQDVTIPSSLISFGDSAFYGCDNLSLTEYEGGCYLGNSDNEHLVFIKPVSETTDNLTLHQNVKLIASGAFNGSAITSITIPGTIKVLNNNTFAGCTALQTVTIENGVETIGDSVFSGCTELVSVQIPDSVTSIGTSVFANCSNLQTVSFGSGISSISSNFFNNCTSLQEVSFPDNITYIDPTAFSGCTLLKSVNLGNGIEAIESSMFEGFTSLTSVTIGTSVKVIGEKAFAGTGLTNVTIPDNVIVIESSAFSPDVNADQTSSLKTVVIGNGVKLIDAKAFLNCDLLESVTLGTSVETIGDSAFSGCDKLTSIEMPNSVAIIGNSAFANSGLTSIEVGNNVKYIGNSAFNGCSQATTVSIPNSVTTIGHNAFESCTKLESVDLGSGVKTIGSDAFATCFKLTSFTVGDNVISFGYDVFRWVDNITFNEYESGYYVGNETNKYVVFVKPTDENLTSISLHANTKVIANHAFDSCTSLITAELPSGLITVGDYAFYQCIELKTISIPDSVTSIGKNAFYGCKKMTTATIGNGVKSVGNGAFDSCNNLTYNKTNNGCYLGNESNKYLVFVKPNFANTASTTSIDLNSNTKVLASGALYGYKNIIYVTLNDGLLTIGDSAFSECSAIINLSIPSSVTTIGSSAFFRLRALRYVTFLGESNLKTIGTSAFYQCDELDEIIIPDSVETIGANAFEACNDLEKVVIGSGVKYIGANAFLSSLNSSMLTNFTFKTTEGWFYNESVNSTCGTEVSFEGLTSSQLRVFFLTTHVAKTWQRV